MPTTCWAWRQTHLQVGERAACIACLHLYPQPACRPAVPPLTFTCLMIPDAITIPLPDTLKHLPAVPRCAPVPAGEIKKRYWRLSLLIHPDKCDHPQANDAFQAVTAAAKELQVRRWQRPMISACSSCHCLQQLQLQGAATRSSYCCTAAQRHSGTAAHVGLLPADPPAPAFLHCCNASSSRLPQDAALRKKVDERREEAELRREFEVAAAQEERERQWRIARGEATAADLAGPAALGPASRDTWMTELPPERRTDGPPVMPTVRGCWAAHGRRAGSCSAANNHSTGPQCVP